MKDQNDKPAIQLPMTDEEPASEFLPGFFTMAFPTLFPDGRGDITIPRVGKNPSMQKWVEHLLKYDRRFAKDPMFIMVVCNIMQKRQAMQIGNLYASNQLGEFTWQELKEKLESGDTSVLRNLYAFGKDIKGNTSGHVCECI